MSSAEILAKYNEWRRGDDSSEMPDPTAIGIAIDSVLAENAALKEENERLKTRAAELDSLVRDIRQHDIDETAKRILDGGRKFNYSLPLNIRERIAAALREPKK